MNYVSHLSSHLCPVLVHEVQIEKEIDEVAGAEAGTENQGINKSQRV